ncbi:MAG: hypothetical protein SOT09_02255 [Candidatus Borkfalkiaceae bacterium]|nr:hypothetical protein [Christensenellaceae bacterium]
MAIYLSLLLSGLLFALQFDVDKYYQTNKPLGIRYPIAYALFGKISSTVILFAVALISGKAFSFNGYTFLAGAAIAILNLTVTIFGMKVLSFGSVVSYTVAIMIGGMAVPAVFGAAVLGEPFGVSRIAAFIMIAAAVILSVGENGKKLSAKEILFYAVVFISNGLIGVFTSLHVSAWAKDVPVTVFSFISSAEAAVIYVPVLFIAIICEKRKRQDEQTEKPVKDKNLLRSLSSAASGALNGVANLLIVVGAAADGIGSVVTYPLSTGGTVFFSLITSAIFYKEKITVKKAISAALIVTALIVYVL